MGWPARRDLGWLGGRRGVWRPLASALVLRLIGLLCVVFVVVTGCGEPPGPADVAPATGHASGGPRAALEAGARLSAALAAADLPGAQAAGRALGAALPGVGLAAPAQAEADAALSALASATSIPEARAAAAAANRAALLTTAAAAGPAADDLYLFSCPMVGGGPAVWVQGEAALLNPFLTDQMPRCGDPVAWPAAAHAHTDGSAIAFHTCPMHPSVRQPGPGACPLCGMALIPVTEGELATGQITIDAGRRQRMGLRTAPLKLGPMVASLRLLGQARWAEGARAELVSRVEGYVTRARVEAVGAPVRRGEVVLELYSPELVAGQEELLRMITAEGLVGPRARSARDRLLRFGVAAADIDAVVAAGVARHSLPVRAPASGVVIEKGFFEGASVGPGARLLAITAPDPLWVELSVYEADLPLVAVGQRVALRRPGGAAGSWSGEITQLNPWIDPATRTSIARVVVDNADGALVAGALLEASLDVPLGEGLLAPVEAVMVLGQKRLVFVDLGDGRLSPREVEVGPQLGQQIHLRSGVSAGEVIVVSGNFLVAAESRLRSAAALWDPPAEVPDGPR